MRGDLNYRSRYGEWALISGAAQGIGASYCDRLAAMGMSLVLFDINQSQMDKTVCQLNGKYPDIEVRPVIVDLADTAALNAAVDQLAALEIGLLIANAGLAAIGRWLEVPLASKINQIAVNCTSTLILAHRLTPGMVERGRGGVIIMASGSAEMGSSFIATYAATKAFDRVFAEGLWAELSPHGIDVTTVMPGAVDTPGFRDTLAAGQQPTALMQPIDPFVVVDAALEGLGNEINVRPATGSGFKSLLFKLMMMVMPRKRLLALGSKAVGDMYDR
jgi:uncharacterized protein